MSGGLFSGGDFNPYSKVDGFITGAVFGLILSIFPLLLGFLIGVPWVRHIEVLFMPLGFALVGGVIGLFLTRRP